MDGSCVIRGSWVGGPSEVLSMEAAAEYGREEGVLVCEMREVHSEQTRGWRADPVPHISFYSPALLSPLSGKTHVSARPQPYYLYY